MRTVNTGVHGTDETLASIQDTMNKLKTLMERSLPAASSNMSNDEDGLTFEEEPLNIDKIAGQTSSLAAECLTVAESVCDKISRSDSIPDFTTEITNAPRSPAHDSGAGSSTGNDQRGRLDSDFDYLVEHTDVLSDSDSDEATEPLDVLTGHIDNNYRMALAAIKSEDFDTAEDHILKAITNAEQQESTYRFPFEDRLRFTEIHAFVLTKQKRFVDATDKYEYLLRTARRVPNNYENKGRLYYSLALMHRDKYHLNHLGGEDHALFDAWKTNGVIAFKHAVKCQGGRRGSLPADEPWKACPSLNQAAELIYDMYVRWDKPAEAATYLRYLSHSEIAHPSAPLLHVNFPVQGAPPTPPSSDAPIGGRRLSISSVGSDSGLESLHRIKTAASKGIFATIGSNNYEATKFILTSAESSFHIDQINEDGLTPLLLAVQNGQTKIVGLLLENDPKPDIKAKGKSGWTVLHYALWGPGRDEMLELLLRHGADVHASTKEGTPLHFAATHNNVRAARRLISQNAALEAEDDAKRTPIVRAALEKKYEMVKLFLNEGALLDTSQFDSKPNIKKFLSSIENPRRGSVSSRGSTSTSSGFPLSWMRRGSRNT
jgi:tetratricopeptide (TPR) repeat protein